VVESAWWWCGARPRGDGGSLLPKSTEKMSAGLEVQVAATPLPSHSACKAKDNVAVERALGNHEPSFLGWGGRSVIMPLLQSIMERRERHFLSGGAHNPLEWPNSNMAPNSASLHSCDARGSTLARYFGVHHLRCSLPPLALSSACRSMNRLGSVQRARLQVYCTFRFGHAPARPAYLRVRHVRLSTLCVCLSCLGAPLRIRRSILLFVVHRWCS
jgi:hypothetical protein